MKSTPENIQISSVDLQRLEALLDSMTPSESPTIEALKAELQRATVLEPKDVPRNVVTMNSVVRFLIEPTGKTFELRLVYPKDVTEFESNLISVTAPMGAALLGLAVGQSIDWVLPGGHKTSVRVLEILDQPEREGRYHV